MTNDHFSFHDEGWGQWHRVVPSPLGLQAFWHFERGYAVIIDTLCEKRRTQLLESSIWPEVTTIEFAGTEHEEQAELLRHLGASAVDTIRGVTPAAFAALCEIDVRLSCVAIQGPLTEADDGPCCPRLRVDLVELPVPTSVRDAVYADWVQSYFRRVVFAPCRPQDPPSSNLMW